MTIYYESAGAVRLHHADVLEVLAAEPAESAQTSVTSPPYWGLRDYGLPPTDWPAVAFAPMPGLPPLTVPAWRGCLGLEPEPLAFVAHLVHVFREVRRALKDDGTLWLNLGDSYATGAGRVGECPGGGRQGEQRRGGHEGKHGRVGPMTQPNRLPIRGLKPKDMIGIPWRVALALQADGWYLRSDVIWAKPNPMPESVTDRPTKAHEYVFLLSKSERYFYDADAVKESGSGRSSGRRGADKAGSGDPMFRVREGFAAVGDVEWHHRNARTIWTIASQPYSGAHFATMPPALAERCILAGSRPGDTVLDPFNGAGTTGLVAMRLGRRYVGVELSAEYCALAVARWREEFSLFLPIGAP
jgi:DNA modification methylase